MIDTTDNPTASVSVIIPCYNSVKTLKRAVDSVFTQTVVPNEIVLVDDGSTDTTVELMYELQSEYGEDRIKVIELGADLGVSTARNSGWEHATQEYVAFLDSDDAWHPKKIALQYQFMQSNPNYMMSGHHFQVIPDEKSMSEIDENYTVENWGFHKLLFKNPFVTPGVMVRRDVPIRFQAGRSDMDDHLFWLEIANKYGEVPKINLPLALIFKATWGESGLSARLWIMEKGNMKNFWYLHKTKRINVFLFMLMIVQSHIRFLRRLFLKYIVKPAFS